MIDGNSSRAGERDQAARERRALWTLDPAVKFLNHGSYGACPRVVLEKQSELRARLERQPVQFFRELEGLLDEARFELAKLLGANGDDLGFVHNATTGVNCVVRSLSFSPGDEILTTDHIYNSCRNTLALAVAQGAKVVVAAVPFPLESASQVTQSLLAAVTPRTRLALVDHVTSPTGLVFPIVEIVRRLQERGVDVLVDGAHAPGMLPLRLDSLGAAYYTGNCHKWLCTPKGSAFLHVRRDRQARKAASSDSLPAILPWAISHGLNAVRTDRSRFRLLWDQTGTLDPTAWLCIPEAIRFLSGLHPGGLPALQSENHALALEGQAILCKALGINLPAPAEMIGSLASVPLPDRPDGESANPRVLFWDPLGERLLAKHQLEAPIFAWPGQQKRLTRISAQAYVQRAEIEALSRALVEELAAER